MVKDLHAWLGSSKHVAPPSDQHTGPHLIAHIRRLISTAARSQVLDLRSNAAYQAAAVLSPAWRTHFGALKKTCVSSKLNWRRRTPRCACGLKKKKKKWGHLFPLLQFLTCWSRYQVAFLKVMFPSCLHVESAVGKAGLMIQPVKSQAASKVCCRVASQEIEERANVLALRLLSVCKCPLLYVSSKNTWFSFFPLLSYQSATQDS